MVAVSEKERSFDVLVLNVYFLDFSTLSSLIPGEIAVYDFNFALSVF